MVAGDKYINPEIITGIRLGKTVHPGITLHFFL